MGDGYTSETLRALCESIYACRKCPNVIPGVAPRKMIGRVAGRGLALMAQAPSENGVRKSGVHWVGPDGKVRPPGGVFLDRHLRRLGYSVDPQRQDLPRPYTTNVLHCWTGKSGSYDRSPTRLELDTCSAWWIQELQVVRPEVLLLLGRPATEAVSRALGENARFADLLSRQGETIAFSGTEMCRFTLPHPSAPYSGKTPLYSDVFSQIACVLDACTDPRPPGETTAQRGDWETTPMPAERKTIPLDLRFSAEEMARIVRGVVPQQMEDKWFIYYEKQKLYLHRSWTGYCVCLAPDGIGQSLVSG